jgi:hypothetical protein
MKMSNTIPIWCATLAFALTTGLSAQSSTTVPKIPSGTTVPPSGHAVPKPTTAPPEAVPPPVVTATGCIERWQAEATAGVPADKGPAGVTHVLTRIQGEDAKRYLLLPDPKLNFAAHLNHRVTLTGTIAPQPSAGASVADSIADPATRETNLPSGGAKPETYQDNLIEVSTLTMVARACGN